MAELLSRPHGNAYRSVAGSVYGRLAADRLTDDDLVADAERLAPSGVGDARVDHQPEVVVEPIAAAPGGHRRPPLLDERFAEVLDLIAGVGIAARNDTPLAGVDAEEVGVTARESNAAVAVGEATILSKRRHATEDDIRTKAAHPRRVGTVEPASAVSIVASLMIVGPEAVVSSGKPPSRLRSSVTG